MPSNTYDVVVLGDEFAGLIAATLIARKGQRVLLALSGQPDSYQLGPHTLPARALPFAGIDSAPVRQVLDALHFQHSLRRKLGPDSPSFQFATPRARLDVRVNDEALAREFQRETEDADALMATASRGAELAALLEPLFSEGLAIPPTGFFERREVARVEDQLLEEAEAWWRSVENHPLGRAMFSIPAVVGGQCIGHATTPVARLRAFDLWRRGAPRLRGDWRTLKETFLDKLDTHGGDVRVATPSSITFGWGGKVTGVVLDDGEEIGAGAIVAAMPIGDVEALCGKHGRKLSPLSERIQLAGHRYVLNLVVDELGIPEGIAHTLMYVGDPERELNGSNAVLIHVSDPDDRALCSVTASAVCPLRPDRSTEASFSDLRAELRETLEQIMPFMTDHVVLTHSPHERLAAEGIEGEFGLDEPLLPEPVWLPQGESSLGIGVIPYTSGLKNLFFCTGQILPGLGLEAQFAVGWQAAKLVLGGSSKKKDYLGSSVVAAGDS